MIGLAAADAETDVPCPNCHSTRLVCRCVTIGEAARDSRPPERIQRRRTAGWRMPAGAVYVGRPSRWGNPFRVHNVYSIVGPPWSVARQTWYHVPAHECTAGYITQSWPVDIAAVVEIYEGLLAVRHRDERDRLDTWLRPLVGRDLACWCPLSVPCHADVLLRYANA